MYMLAFRPERFAARRQDMNLGGVTEDVLGQGCDGLNDVFAAVEYQEYSLLAQMREDDRQWLLRNRHKTQLRCKRAHEQPRIFEGCKIEEVNSSLKFDEQTVRQVQGDGGFANPACPDDRYETVLFEVGGELTNDIVATDDE